MTPATPPRKARTIDELRKYCKPTPLKEEGLKAFYIETDDARDPHQDTIERLAKSLELETEPSRILFYGHPGCGKSTELNKFLEEYKETWFPVKFSVLDEMTPSNALAEDLILIITSKIVEEANKAGIKEKKELLDAVYKYFATVTQEKITGRDAEISATAGVDTSSTSWGKLIGLFAGFKGEIKMNSHSEETAVYTLRKRASDLTTQANRVIEAISGELKTRNKRLLVVVEDIDKLDLKQAQEMFVNRTSLLTGLSTNIIYTIPIYLFHSPDLSAFKPYFDDVIGLPMIKIAEPQKGKPPKPHPQGRKVIEAIIKARVEEGLIRKNAMDLLIDKTGGVLRHVFEALNTVSTMAKIKEPVSKDAIRYGLDQLRKTCWQQIALPVDNTAGINSVDELYDRLLEYAEQQRQGEKPIPKSDPINQLLLKCCALIEYNGEGWFGVHPLIIENLEKLGRLKA